MATKGQGAALSVDIKPAPQAGAAVNLLAQAQTLAVVDKASHVACLETLKGAKALKREIEAHYDAIKSPLNTARNTVLQMERDHLAPILQAIQKLEGLATGYVREQERIEREAAEAARREAERVERERREKEQAEAERLALEYEAASPKLSEREATFVEMYTNALMAGAASTRAAVNCARVAGFKDPEASAAKLLKSPKIDAAISARQQAEAVRREAAAKASAPIVVDVAPAETQIGKVAGTSTRTYYACRQFDTKAVLVKLAEAYGVDEGITALVDKHLANQTKVGDEVFEPLQALLSEQARSLKDLFPKAWPMCKLTKREGVAG